MGILGIELGASAVRGVMYDPERQEIVFAAETPLSGAATDASGALIDKVLVSALDDVLYNLGITAPETVRSGITIGPKSGGVGSGPALHDWLLGKSRHIRQPICYAGNIGISFAPLPAIEAAQRIASQSGLVPDRVELAPVAAARVLGNEVEDVILVGSGLGWRARMRRYEVLEALAADDVTADQPLQIIASSGQALEVERYSSVTIAESLSAVSLLDLGQLAVSVGAALGVAYDSGGNLLVGQLLGQENAGQQARSAQGGQQKERQSVADFFTRSPRQDNPDLVAANAGHSPGLDQHDPIQILDGQIGNVEHLDDRRFEFDRGVAAAAAPGLDEVDPYGNGGLEVSADQFDAGDESLFDPYAPTYVPPVRPVPARPTPEVAPYGAAGESGDSPGRTLAPEDLMQTYHEPAGLALDQSFDLPAPLPETGNEHLAPMAPVSAPPPRHRDRGDDVFEDEGFGGETFGDDVQPASTQTRQDRSQGTNQPALVSNEALIRQFSPEDAENWTEKSRSGLVVVIALLAVSAIVLVLLYLLL